MSFLKVDNIRTYYGNIQALKGISLTVEEGECVTLIGSNGAGKSTTLRSISGLTPPRTGSIKLAGEEISMLPPQEIVGLGICQSPEGRKCFQRMTVRENLELGAYLRRDSQGITADLKRVLEPIAADYDYILIDSPPSLGLLTINGLTAAHSVVVPMQCEYFALEGISQLMTTVDRVRDAVNPSLEIEGIVLTMFDERMNLSRQVAEEVRTHVAEKVYESLIPRNVRLGEAPSFGKPNILYDIRSRGSEAYISLAREFIRRAETVL